LIRRANHRGAALLFPLGVPILAAGLILSALTGLGAGRWLGYMAGVSLLGVIDDLLGGDGPRGVRGHGAALLTGRPSTGALKALGTIALAVWAAPGDGAAYVLEVGVLALAPHAANLIDLQPGRVEKAAALALAGLCGLSRSLEPLDPVWPFALATAAGALLTLRERAMLGDSGASLIGAVAGVACITALGPAGTAIALSALIAISLYGEFRSISAAIERVPLLERLDSLGRVN
jgi:UDP-GlcNAc:undecaprenyl-phosphate/decaprenyl-phosphate GlcNAc-1-phosphate transferase